MNNNFNLQLASREEQTANSRILKTFTFAFTSNDIRVIEDLLHPDGVYFGKYTREKALGVFFKYFFGENGIDKLFNVHINKGWSIYPLPGSEVLEFRCADGDPFSGDPFQRKRFGQPQDNSIGERVFRFCFEFKDELISRVEISRKFIGQDDAIKDKN